jgi:N-acetylmuramoyl-L-alanine amidase
MKITHSAGHALNTSGKESPDGYKEWQYTNEIVKLVMAELEQYDGVQQKRIDDPTGKTDYPLTVRSNMVNSFAPDLHIDYHLNAAGPGGWYNAAWGTETFVFSFTQKESVAIGEKVQNNLVSSLGFRNRGLKQSNLHMLREVNAKAKILIEYAFMTHQEEAMKMRTIEYQQKAAQAVVNAIVAQYGLKKKVVRVGYTDKVTVPNTAYWQAALLVQEYQKRGFKCYTLPSNPQVEQDRNDPAPFIVETDFKHANMVLMELKKKGYSKAVWETI